MIVSDKDSMKLQAVHDHIVGSVAGKILKIRQVKDIVLSLRKKNLKVGFTNGCFDCCHLGHLTSLQCARSACNVLIVGVNTDRWIRVHKGASRPIQDQTTRMTLLASLFYVDYVVPFSTETALPLVKLIRPDVIAKEGYAIENWPEGRYVQSYGGKAISLARVLGYSTTLLATKMGQV